MGLLGGMGFWWRDMNVHVLSYSTHHVTAQVLDDDDVVLWTTVGIYGRPEATNKHLAWSLMREIRNNIAGLVVFFEDINESCTPQKRMEGGC